MEEFYFFLNAVQLSVAFGSFERLFANISRVEVPSR